MLIRKNIAAHSQLLTNTQSPYVLWVKFNKDAFGLECIVGSAYLPGETSPHKDILMFEAIKEDVNSFKNTHNIPVCLIGDLNSRTGILDDTFIIEPSVINNCEFDDFAQELFDLSHTNDTDTMNGKRHNVDHTVNDNGNRLINFCKVSNMKIVNGRFGSDKGIGEPTFNKLQCKSTIDYCIVTPSLAPFMSNFKVGPFNPSLSDFHSPIILTLKANQNLKMEAEVTSESDINYEPISTRWCNEKKSRFPIKI